VPSRQESESIEKGSKFTVQGSAFRLLASKTNESTKGEPVPEIVDPEPTQVDLNPKQYKAITALLDQPTITKAAIAAGIGHATMHGWLQQPEFRRAYMHARWKVVQQSISQVQRFTSEAAALLRDIMNDKSSPAYARIAAANSIMNNGLRGVELEDHDERLAEIQKDIAEIKSEESTQSRQLRGPEDILNPILRQGYRPNDT
jgi:hypothetical protein